MSTAARRHTPATAAIQRRLERWELDHLRLLARQQVEQIEELERRLSWAEDCAERWRDDALDLQTQLADDTGGAPGLTMSGRLVVVADRAADTPTPPPIGHPWPGIADARVPTRTESALLYANPRDRLDRDEWHWTSTPEGSANAWLCDFTSGYQGCDDRSAKGCAVAVRRFDVRSFDPSEARP